MQDWNQLARRLSGVSQTVGMCWELVNRKWKVWMSVRLLQSLSVAERGVSFQDCRLLAIGASREDDLCNDVSQDGVIVIVCYSSSTLYMMSYITFLQALRHNFCNRRERKQNRPFTRPIFPVWWKMVWERDYQECNMSIFFSSRCMLQLKFAIY